ncbi:MAG: cupin domain-containing protein [Methanotrichaceae archaeon]|jgi:quercetin dioxygenase-like cupin family protein
MNKPNDLSESVIFPKGQKITDEHFIGTTWVETLVPMDSTFNCQVANVTFEPGARNNWHKHPGGQVLLVTGGIGYYQEEGKLARMIQEGDVVKINPNVKHWHGAKSDRWLVHIAIITNPQKGDAEWLEPVANKEYYNLKMQ